VARVTNLAEAGFLTDELVGLGIDAQIYQLEEFSALTDRWATVYLIRVPTAAARDAAAQIRVHLSEESDEADAAGTFGFRFSADHQALDPLLWRPVALVVLAGVASFMLGQRFSDKKVERRPPRESFSTVVGATGRSFVSEPAPDEPQYRLTFDRRRAIWYLDTDRDSDGMYDHRLQFQAADASW
jgi:hypothetical protein